MNPENKPISQTPPPATDPLPSADTLMTAPAQADKTASMPGGVGRFVRKEVHATGGMGRVWLARDLRLQRDVALKELRPELGNDPEVGKRFLAEARITGGLEHPGIVPIYELVQEGEAIAYAMRFLRGRTLSEAIKAYHQDTKDSATRLDRVALLQAFSAVCQTVAFAHSRGVLHRDLKGQNVLIGDFGEVIVLDWGLAKEIGDRSQRSEDRNQSSKAENQKSEVEDQKSEVGDRKSEVGDKIEISPESSLLTPHSFSSPTLPGQVMGTPNYMAPEQAAGETVRIDQRSDIYSLGAILYEILTGQPPFTDQSRLHGETTVQALLRRIQDEPPTRPGLLVANVPPPLQAVCMKALAKEPDNRYQNAADLAQEVQRWLADLPVQAHRDPWNVRVGRWARRHRTLVTSLTVLVAAIVVSLSVSILLLNQEQARTLRARARAEQNFNKAQAAVDRYFTQVSEDRLLNEPGMLPLRKELLSSARAFYEDFARDHQKDLASRQALGQAQLKLARITRAMGDREQALKILEEAQLLFQELVQTQPETDSHELGLAQSYLDHGYQSYLLKGRSGNAQTDLEKARDLLANLVKKNPSPLHREELAHAQNALANYQASFFTGDDQAEAAKKGQISEQGFLSATALWKQLADEEPNVPIRLKDLAGGYTNLAILYAKFRDPDKMKIYLDKAMALREQLVKLAPQSPDYHENLAASYNNLGNYYKSKNQTDLAEKAFRAAVAIREKLVHDNCQVVQFQKGLANSYFNLGNLYFVEVSAALGTKRISLLSQGKHAYQQAIAITKRLHEDHPQEQALQVEYAKTLASMGDLLTQEKQALAIPWYDQAIAQFEELQKHEELIGEARRALRNSYWGRAEARTELGQFAQAIADWDQALALDDGSHKQEWEARRLLLLKKVNGSK